MGLSNPLTLLLSHVGERRREREIAGRDDRVAPLN